METGRQKQNAGQAPHSAIEEEQCPVCWGLLCEPVLWPECSHQFCLLCMLKTRQRPKPSCPLCRSPAPRVSKVDSLQVDSECAARVRQSVGFSAYTTQRRKLWAAAVETPEDLEAMPIYCTGLNTKHLRFGRRIGLRFSEPRCCELVKRAMAPGGSRRFAAVTRSKKGEEIPIGSRGCLFEIVESSEGTDGHCQVIVETGSACKVLAVKSEGMHHGPPLLIGRLEQFEQDDEEDEEDGNDDLGEDDAIVLDEEGQLGLLRERVQLLELLNTAMELEQARLEQRRLELTMLLSQRRLYQELIEMRSELGDLVNLAGTIPRNSIRRASGRALRHHPEGIGSANIASEQRRPDQVHGYVRNASGPRETSGVSVHMVTPSLLSSSRVVENNVHLARGSRAQVRRANTNSDASQRHNIPSSTFSDARAFFRNAAASSQRSTTAGASVRNAQSRNMHM